MGDVPPYSMKQLQQVCEAGSLQRGLACYEEKRVRQASRFGSRLFGEVEGSGSTYRVTIDFTGQIRARCACPAARRTSLCKHAAALLVTWAKAPESFAVAAEDPGLQQDPARRKAAVRKGRQDTRALLTAGLQSLNQFLEDVISTGLSAITPDRARLALDLAGNLRTYRLRRLSTALMQFADELIVTGTDGAEVDLRRYASQVTDMVFTARAVTAVNEGKLKDDRYLEELVGRTWPVKSLPEVSGLRLCELDYRRLETVDGFRVEASTFVDLGSGELFCEKLIVPLFLRGQTGAKPSRFGSVVELARGRRYPGFPPVRLRLEEFCERPVSSADVAGLLRFADGSFDAMRTRWLGFRKDPFAPDAYDALVRVRGFVAGSGGLAVLDEGGWLLPVSGEQGPQRRIDEALSRAAPVALFGRLQIAGTHLAMEPASLITRRGETLHIESLTWVKP